MTNEVLLGAIAALGFATALILLRSWRMTRDRFFLFLAASFSLMALVRLLLATLRHLSEREPLIYLLNLLAMLVLVYAIVDKNRKIRPPSGS